MDFRTTTWVGATAKQIARAVRRGDTSATRVVADHLDKIETTDPTVEAFREIRAGAALAEAEEVDRQDDLANLPLAGVPVAVKEDTGVAGLPTWNGSAAARRAVAERDHELVRRLRGAGAVVVGTTRMPELGLWATTDDDTGVTRNPWNLDVTPGGSSGGSAAAVAAGLVPMAHADDGLGSIRIPAACCGLVGLKPGRGVLPGDPDAHDWFGLTEHGVLTTTVADAALGFSVLAGRNPARLVEPGRLRIGVSVRSPVAGAAADRPNRGAVSDTARLLVRAGHDTLTAEPRYGTGVRLDGFGTWLVAAHQVTEGLDRSALQSRTRRHAQLGRWLEGSGWAAASSRDAWRERAIGFFADRGIDVLLTPALAAAPPPATTHSRTSWLRNMWVNTRYAPYAAPWNIAGLPALVVPMGRRDDGVPLGVQLVGPPDSELLLLAVAGQLEAMNPWERLSPLAL